MESGIYKIVNIVNNKIYIGSAVNIRTRWSTHKCLLKKNEHKNAYLQNAWNKYGESNFIFEVLEYVKDIDDLITCEQKWIDFYNSTDNKIGYNICKNAGSTLGKFHSELTKNKIRYKRIGYKHTQLTIQKYKEERKGELNPMYGKNHSDETKEKISIHKKGKTIGEDNPFYGKHHIEETKHQLSEKFKGKIRRAKLNWDKVHQIKELLTEGMAITKIAETYNVSIGCIRKIKSGERWAE